MIYILIVIAIVAAEHFIKNYIEKNIKDGEERDIAGGRITVQKYHNKGAFLNFLDNKKEIVKAASSVCLGLLLLLFVTTLPRKGSRLYKLGLSLVLGGAASNVSDRFRRGYVVDYFSINYKKLKNIIFNIGDFAIFAGCFFLFLSEILMAVFKSGSDKTLK